MVKCLNQEEIDRNRNQPCLDSDTHSFCLFQYRICSKSGKESYIIRAQRNGAGRPEYSKQDRQYYVYALRFVD